MKTILTVERVFPIRVNDKCHNHLLPLYVPRGDDRAVLPVTLRRPDGSCEDGMASLSLLAGRDDTAVVIDFADDIPVGTEVLHYDPAECRGRVVAKLKELLADEQDIDEWLAKPNPAFGGKSPDELILRCEVGPLWDALYRLESGVPS